MTTEIEVVQGTTLPVTLTVSQSGSAVNLTGKQLVFVVGTSPQLVRKTGVNGSGFTITNAAAGIALLELSVADTRALPAKTLQFSIELWDSGGAVQSLIVEGQLKVRSVVNTDE